MVGLIDNQLDMIVSLARLIFLMLVLLALTYPLRGRKYNGLGFDNILSSGDNMDILAGKEYVALISAANFRNRASSPTPF